MEHEGSATTNKTWKNHTQRVGLRWSKGIAKNLYVGSIRKRFQFDVLSTCADFKGVLLLRTLLIHHLDLEFIDERKPGFKAGKGDLIRNLKRTDRIRQGMIVGELILVFLYLYLNQQPPS